MFNTVCSHSWLRKGFLAPTPSTTTTPQYFSSSPKHYPIQLPTWYRLTQHGLCQPVWTMSLPSTSSSILFLHSLTPPSLRSDNMTPSHSNTVTHSNFFCYIFLWSCLSAVELVAGGGSGWLKRWFMWARWQRNSLISAQIAPSQMSSLPVNRSTSQRNLTAKMLACKHVNIQCKLSFISSQFTSTKPWCGSDFAWFYYFFYFKRPKIKF